MEGPMLGIVVTVLAVVLAPRFGWEPGPLARGLLAAAGTGFGVSLILRGLSIGTPKVAQDLQAASGVAQGTAAILLVAGVLIFGRRPG